MNTDQEKINNLLTRGVDEIIGQKKLEEKLKSGKKLRIKLGIDPTSPNLHLGRSIPLLKLRDFQELGHQIVLIVGDFTGVIGDTSDKESERPMLSKELVKENLKNYKEQAGRIIDLSKTEVVFNSDWLSKLGYNDVGEHADEFSLAEFIARDNIRRRLEAGTRISLREVLYPLMQGYDSVEVKSDVEVGGTDQRFNMLAGRALQEHFKQEPQAIIMNPLVEGTDGRKMSSSWGNTINFTDEPNDMFGKIMSITDDLIIKYFEYFTRLDTGVIRKIEKDLEGGSNPRDTKVQLAKEIVKLYYNEDDAQKAEDNFVNTFSKKQTPDKIKELSPKAFDIISVLVEAGFVKSTSDARRDIAGGGVKINDEKVTGIDVQVKSGDIVQKGKRFFVKISAKS
ncbi:MAG: tyrosine--tRNA ligase [bacterium]|nr:tyrosine--tRNA ligase [bacterium]